MCLGAVLSGLNLFGDVEHHVPTCLLLPTFGMFSSFIF